MLVEIKRTRQHELHKARGGSRGLGRRKRNQRLPMRECRSRGSGSQAQSVCRCVSPHSTTSTEMLLQIESADHILCNMQYPCGKSRNQIRNFGFRINYAYNSLIHL
jgi:hypothetical protein